MSLHDEHSYVIAGIAGRFPMSNNVAEFWQCLIEGLDMVSDDIQRWDYCPDIITSRGGRIKDAEKFDAEYFAIPGNQADIMDPRLRILLELYVEAIFDAGINPNGLSETKTGVFAGASGEEACEIWKRSRVYNGSYVVLGGSSMMLSNRISYVMNLTGPSLTIDTGCSSSLSALRYALLSLQNGDSSSALVSAVNMQFDPRTSQIFNSAGFLSPVGKCKTFDEATDGYVRSESAVVLYISRDNAAKRRYATVVHIKVVNDGYKLHGVPYPSRTSQEQLIKDVYLECGVNPSEVEFLELHGTGTKVGDIEEGNAVFNVFCKETEFTLLVGSVKSNMGHCEAASGYDAQTYLWTKEITQNAKKGKTPSNIKGLVGLIKLVLSNQHGILPGNLHFNKPNGNIPGLTTGRIKMVTQPLPFIGTYAAASSYGIGGTIAHVLLKFHPNVPLSNSSLVSCIPLLVPVSGRTQEAVDYQLKKIITISDNQGLIFLIHEIYKENITRHAVRGYALICSGVPELKIENCSESIKRPTYFLFNGLCSDVIAVKDFILQFEVFQESVKSSLSVLEKYKPELLGKRAKCTPENSEFIIEVIVTTTIIQIALTDVLSSIGVTSEGIIGYSIGEIAAGYADTCIKREEAILASLATSVASAESPLPSGLLMDIYLSWDELIKLLPPEVCPVIFYSPECVTVCGPTNAIRSLSQQLGNDSVQFFVTEFRKPAFHHPLMAECGNKILEMTKNITFGQRSRSSKWLSTSVPENCRNSDAAKYVSIDYYINNISSPIYFHMALRNLPEDSVILELGPVPLMESMIKQNKKLASIVQLMSSNSEEFFLRSLGNLYIYGVNFDTQRLYPAVNLPVNSNTPSISPMVKWQHSISWKLPNVNTEVRINENRVFTIDLQNTGFAFMSGHTLDGKVVIPAAGYIWLVWSAFAIETCTPLDQLPVLLEDLRFEHQVQLTLSTPVRLEIRISPCNGTFEVIENGRGVCQGRIQAFKKKYYDATYKWETLEPGQWMGYPGECFYKEMLLRGYEYSGIFQGIQFVSFDGKWATVEWQNNWIAFLDTVLQALIPLGDQRKLMLPTRLERVTIDPFRFHLVRAKRNNLITLQVCKHLKLARCAGIEFCGCVTRLIRKQKISTILPTMCEFRFDWFIDEADVNHDLEEIVCFYLGIVIDNVLSSKITFSEIVSVASESVAKTFLNLCLPKFPHPGLNLVTKPQIYSENYNDAEVFDIYGPTKHLSDSSCIFTNCLNAEMIPQVRDLLMEGGFVIVKFPDSFSGEYIPKLMVISKKRIQNEWIYLYRKHQEIIRERRFIHLQANNFSWVESLKLQLLLDANKTIFLTSHAYSGIIGFVKCLVLEMWNNVRCVYTLDLDPLVLEDAPLNAQLDLDLLFNVLKDERWGCYSSIPINRRISQITRCSQHVFALPQDIGDLSSMQWVESPLQYLIKELCEIKFAPITFKDILLATGKIPNEGRDNNLSSDDQMLGYEYAGVYKGNRVNGITLGTSLATTVDVNPVLISEVPQWWTLGEAATVSVAYYTAYTALVHRAGLKCHESVLVHSGSGSTGLALITLALHHDCTVFTTAGSPGRRNFLTTWFPKIKPEHVSNSRSEYEFERCVLEGTHERGVDIVVNSLADEKLKASLRCLAKNGRFLEIGLTDMINNTNLGMNTLLKNVDIQSIVMAEQPDKVSLHIKALIKLGIESGVVKPLPFVCFAPDKLAEAFKFMTFSRHVGKVQVDLTRIYEIPSRPRSSFYPHKVYIVVGGMGGMGIELCNWMSERNVKFMVLCCKQGPLTAYQSYRMQYLHERGVTIILNYNDVTTLEGVESVIAESKVYGSIGGIFNLAMALRDAFFIDQTPYSFSEACSSKVNTTLHFDTLSRLLLPELDHFVVFSSLTAGRGFPSQTNYGYANSAMERICEKRKLDKLPALAIQWGAIGDVGYVAQSTNNVNRDLERIGVATQTLQSWLQALDTFLKHESAVVSSYVLLGTSDINANRAKASILDAVSDITGTRDLFNLDPSTKLSDLGVDSLMLLQIQQVIMDHENGKQRKIAVSVELTIAELRELDSSNVEQMPQDAYKG